MFTIACHIYVSSNKRGRVRCYTYKYTFIKNTRYFFKGNKKVTEVAGPTPHEIKYIPNLTTKKKLPNKEIVYISIYT